MDNAKINQPVENIIESKYAKGHCFGYSDHIFNLMMKDISNSEEISFSLDNANFVVN